MLSYPLLMRRLALVLLFVAGASADAQFRETIEVVRILVDVRVTDFDGDPVTDLTAADFTVRIGRKRAAVESAIWIDDVAGEESLALRSDGETEIRLPAQRRGRLFVAFVQTDFGRNSWRTTGQMSFSRYATELIESLEPEDRVAVFSFDSHLKFRSDFTSDKTVAAAAVRDSIFIDRPPPPPPVPSPSLASSLDPDEMRRAGSSEVALLIIANALRKIEGPKSLLLIGWGLGDLVSNHVRMKPIWPAVRYALNASRTTIFSLDTTSADYHDLEIGLSQAAEETGGFYVKTHVFPRMAIERVARTVSGHYELEIRRPASLRLGTHALDVRVNRRGVNVLAPSTYADRGEQ